MSRDDTAIFMVVMITIFVTLLTTIFGYAVGYETGYKTGQIDYANEHICVKLVQKNDGSSVWEIDNDCIYREH